MRFDERTLDVSLLPGAQFALEPVSIKRMMFAAAPLLGTAMCWRCLLILSVPYFVGFGEDLFVSKTVWLMGPVLGVFLNPIVGHFSDRCTSTLGRRRPFLIFGLASMIVGLFLLILCYRLDSFAVFPVALLGYVLTVVGATVTQCPLRAQLADMAAYDQQHIVQTIGGLMGAFGDLIGSITVLGSRKALSNDLDILLSLLCLVVIIAAALNLYYTEDVSVQGLTEQQPRYGVFGIVGKVYRTLSTLPPEPSRLCLLQALVWLSWFCLVPSASTFFSEEYEEHHLASGMHYASFGLFLSSVVEVIACVSIFHFIDKINASIFFAFACALLVVSCIITALTLSFRWGTCALALSGVAMACCQIFPFSATGKHFWQGSDVALSMSSLDMIACLAMIVSVALWQVMHQRVFALMGAGWAFLALVVAVHMHIRPTVTRRGILV
eukprot:c4884_g1_i1.p1 GENE.c4884_g1_i1~~c4884_g1_i1.p1  ORF type:complete len:450 (-),score=92.37 c4884_g1_i1:40-1353(-)